MSETNEDWPEITIDDSFITIHSVGTCGDDWVIPRWLRAPLLDALLQERGYEKRWAIFSEWTHAAEAWFNNEADAQEYVEGTHNVYGPEPIYVPLQREEPE